MCRARQSWMILTFLHFDSSWTRRLFIETTNLKNSSVFNKMLSSFSPQWGALVADILARYAMFFSLTRTLKCKSSNENNWNELTKTWAMTNYYVSLWWQIATLTTNFSFNIQTSAHKHTHSQLRYGKFCSHTLIYMKLMMRKTPKNATLNVIDELKLN